MGQFILFSKLSRFTDYLHKFASQYLTWDRLKFQNVNVAFSMISQIRGFLDSFEKHTCTTFVWVLARTTHNFAKMTTPACRGLKNECFIFLDFFKILSFPKYKDGKVKSRKLFSNVFTIFVIPTLTWLIEATRRSYWKIKKWSTQNLSVIRIKSLGSPELMSKSQSLDKMTGRYLHLRAISRNRKIF